MLLSGHRKQGFATAQFEKKRSGFWKCKPELCRNTLHQTAQQRHVCTETDPFGICVHAFVRHNMKLIIQKGSGNSLPLWFCLAHQISLTTVLRLVLYLPFYKMGGIEPTKPNYRSGRGREQTFVFNSSQKSDTLVRQFLRCFSKLYKTLLYFEISAYSHDLDKFFICTTNKYFPVLLY